MRIRYVVSTMVFWWREHTLSFEQECQFLKSLGFGVELWPNIRGHKECRYEKRNWPRLITATEGMLVSMRSRTDQPNIEQWAEQIECAKMLNANIVADLQSLHIDLNAEPGPIKPSRKHRDRHVEVNCDFAAEVVEMAQSSSVELCLETGPLPTLKKVGEKFESLRFCLDTGHANIDREFTFKQYVDELTPRVTHLHLTDNCGRIDDHEPPGVPGGMSRENWDYLLRALTKYDNDVIGSFEMCPCTPGVMIYQASQFLFDVLKWPDQPRQQTSPVDMIYNPT